MKKLASLAISMVAIAAGALPVMANQTDENHASYTWVIGAVTPGATAVAPDGSTIFMAGSGPLMAGPGGAAGGGGTWMKSNHEHGTFTVTGVGGFVSYGSGAAQGFPAAFTGGEAKLRVTLSNGQTGLLTIVCLLGTPPPGKMEGIQLVLGSGVSGEFTKQDGGSTVFIKKP